MFIAVKCAGCEMAQVLEDSAATLRKCKVCGEKRGDFELLGEAAKSRDLRPIVQRVNQSRSNSLVGFVPANLLSK